MILYLNKKRICSGQDGIGTSLIKEIITPIIEPLTFIFAISTETGIIPSDLKMTKVIPLFKTGDPGSFTNYRLISILPCLYFYTYFM